MGNPLNNNESHSPLRGMAILYRFTNLFGISIRNIIAVF
jgi:hypothetical protein